MKSTTSTLLDALAGALLGAVATLLLMQPVPGDTITGAHGVLSPCGFYNIVTIHADGTHRSYSEGPPGPEVMAAINELPAAQRSITQVPCPTMQVPQREAKSQNPPDSRQAREAPRDGPNGPRAG